MSLGLLFSLLPTWSAQIPAPETASAASTTPATAAPAEKLDELQVGPPGADELFRLESESAARDRIRNAAAKRKVSKVDFPEDAVLPEAGPPAAVTPPLLAWYEAAYLCHPPRRFYDEGPERYGRRVPFVQPLLSTGRYFGQTIILPVRMALRPPWIWECERD